jgi:signal transduction histidine kinase
LLQSYLGAMAAVMGISAIAIYQVFAYTLYQRFDQQLVTLGDAAAHDLSVVPLNSSPSNSRLPKNLDTDGDLDIPWEDLREGDQSIEWYNANRQLLSRVGKHFPDSPLTPRFHIWQHNGMRAVTIPVYLAKSKQADTMLQGYMRVSDSTEEIEESLHELLVGMGVGGAVALILMGGTGWWLTRRAVRPIEQSVCQLRQFTADASHELRSPLTAIKTAVEVMQSHPERIHPSDTKKLDAVASATRQMTHLVEDLLLLTRTDAGSLPIIDVASAVPIDDLLEDLITLLLPKAEAKAIDLQVAESTGIWVNGNAEQLRRLLQNLLENALQYTPPGGRVSVTAKSAGGVAFIKVEDTGIGISPDQIPLVFERFWRADQARSYREDGSGLGLAIAQAIAHAHDGEITVTSQVGVGSCFQVRLPIA